MDWQCLKNYLWFEKGVSKTTCGLKRVKDLSKPIETFMKNYDENSDKGYILEVSVAYP